MTIPELTSKLHNQISLLKALVNSHAMDLNQYPTGDYSLASLAKLEYCYNNLLTVNDILAKPITEDLAGEVDPLPPAG
jgi:hypothetical protein